LEFLKAVRRAERGVFCGKISELSSNMGALSLYHKLKTCLSADLHRFIKITQIKEYKHKELTDKIINAFYCVYNELGFGFLENCPLSVNNPIRYNSMNWYILQKALALPKN
jgi:hypothetical protein